MEKEIEKTSGLPIWEDPDVDFSRKGDEDFFKGCDAGEEELSKYIDEARSLSGGNPFLQEIPEPVGGIGNVD